MNRNQMRNDYQRADRYDEDRRYQTRGYGYGHDARRDMHGGQGGYEEREQQQRVWDSAHHYHRGFDHGYEQGLRDAHRAHRASYDDDRYGFAGRGDYDRAPGGAEGYDDRYGGSGHRGYNHNRYGEESTTYGWDRRR